MKASGLALGCWVNCLIPGSLIAQLPPVFHVDTVAPGTYVVWESDALAMPVHGNTTFIVGSDAVLVVDGSRTRSAANATMELLRQITDKPVRYLVNTHWHEDHVLGNSAYAESFPGLILVAHSATAAAMRHEAEEEFPSFVDGLERRLATLRERLETGRNGSGDALTEEARRRTEQQVEMLAYLVPEDRAARWAFPEVTFEERADINLGNRVVELHHLGRGNTAGDVVAYLPDDRVLVAGDLLVYPVPYGSGSFPEDWVRVMDRLAEFSFEAIVPGHGPVERNRDYLNGFTRLLNHVVDYARSRSAAGGSAVEIIGELEASQEVHAFLTEFADREDARRALTPFFVRPVVGSLVE